VSLNRIVLLDNEAVRALRDPAHRKHRRVMVYVLEAARRTARAVGVGVAVPTAVRVEAGWDRTAPSWAFVNQLGMVDIPLGSEHSDAAAGIRKRTGVSVADAHLGAAIQKAESNHVVVITSDPHDMRKVAEGKPIELVVL
jgi:predicted nucleic acid-binding protein